MGSLSGFDRLVFRGTLRRLLYPQGMDYCLAFLGVLLKDFAQYVLQMTARLKEASLAAARRADRPIQYLASSQTSKEDLALLKAVARGEFNLNGFRNRDLVKLLFPSDQELTSTEKRRQSSAITRKLRLLRAHGLIKKVPKTHRYHLTTSGSKAITAIIAALQASSDSLIKLAA